jgi:hypothetical protein
MEVCMGRPPDKRPAPPEKGTGGPISSMYGDLEEAIEDIVEVVGSTPEAAEETVRATIAYAELFAGGANEYVQRFHDIKVPDYRVDAGKIEKSGATVNTPVREYLNNRLKNFAKLRPEMRLGLKDFLLSNPATIFKGQFKVARDGDGMTVSRDGLEVLSVRISQVSSCFYGKGTPDMLAKTIELLGIWVLYCREIRKIDKKKIPTKWKDKEGWHKETFEHEIEDLPTMVGRYLGIDCNGFTGRYWKAKFPWLEIDPGTTEEAYVKDETHVRKKLEDIRSDDTAVFNDGSYHHVATVGQILNRTPDELRLLLSESRTKEVRHGGPQSNIWVVRPQRDSKKKPVESKFDVVGRTGETFVKFVEPYSVERKSRKESKK